MPDLFCSRRGASDAPVFVWCMCMYETSAVGGSTPRPSEQAQARGGAAVELDGQRSGLRREQMRRHLSSRPSRNSLSTRSVGRAAVSRAHISAVSIVSHRFKTARAPGSRDGALQTRQKLGGGAKRERNSPAEREEREKRERRENGAEVR